MLLPQEYLHQEMWLSGKLLQVLTTRGEQNRESSKAEFLEKWQTSGGKGRTLWENEPNSSTQCHKSAVLTSSHGAILWIMSFRWPIIRSSWKSYGNVSVHSVSNCKILGPNFLIRAWNGNQNDAQGLKWVYSLKSQQIHILLDVGPDFQRRHLRLHLQNLHTCKLMACCTNDTFWHANIPVLRCMRNNLVYMQI